MYELIINIKILMFSIRKRLLKAFVFIPLFVIILDTIYKSYYGITYHTKQNCIIYAKLPRWAFTIYENLIELWFVIIIGIFVSQLIEKYFIQVKSFIPKKLTTAFLFASILPVCACSVIPIVKTLSEKVNLRIAYVIIFAAPILNPYIVVLSFSVLGTKYTIYRIMGSFAVSISSAIMLDFFNRDKCIKNLQLFNNCNGIGCKKLFANNTYEETFSIFKNLLPYILVATVISIFVDFIYHYGFFNMFRIHTGFLQSFTLMLIGIPIYLCNGADIITLSPLIKYGGLDLPSAVSFSLTSTGVCFSSFILLLKVIGKKQAVMAFAVFFSNVILNYLILHVVDKVL